MEGGYASLETYIKPDTISGQAGDYVYGAWRVQIFVRDFCLDVQELARQGHGRVEVLGSSDYVGRRLQVLD